MTGTVRLTEIAFRLPPAGAPFLSGLRTLLAGVAQGSAAPGRLTLTPAAPPGALPATVFETAPVVVPALRFGTSDGDCCTREAASEWGDGVAFDGFAGRLGGHVYVVDHTGMDTGEWLVTAGGRVRGA